MFNGSPFTDSNTVVYINAESGFAVFGNDIIVPVELDKNDEGTPVYVLGPCPHLEDKEFHIPVDSYMNPALN